MIKVWVLVAIFGANFSITPFTDEAACRSAIDGLAIAVVDYADCAPANMMIRSGSRYAPERAPLAPHKAGRLA